MQRRWLPYLVALGAVAAALALFAAVRAREAGFDHHLTKPTIT